MDFEIVRFLNHLGYGTWVDRVTTFFETISFILIFYLILIILAYLFNKKNWKIIFFGAIVAFFIDILITDLLIKGYLVDHFNFFRLQPWQAYPGDISAIGKTISSASFPSAHMSNVFAVLAIVVFYWRKLWPWTLAFALIIAFSLLHNGVHYPSDILAGSILGFIYGLVAIYLSKQIKRSGEW